MIKSKSMGQITIEVPQRIKRNYRITDRDFAEKFLSDLEKFEGLAENKKLSAEDVEDIKEAKKSLAEFRRTGESYSVNELREEFGL